MTTHTYAGHTLAEIKAAAEAATPGTWESVYAPTEDDYVAAIGSCRVIAPDARFIRDMERDADHIATANPATVLAMAVRIEQLDLEADDLRTTMIAAAEEIHEHWQAHCDADGYGPANLMDRLERGVSAGYPGYNAGQFTRAEQRIAELERERDSAIVSRREAQMDLQAVRTQALRAGDYERRNAVRMFNSARLEGWKAAMETAGKVCDGRAVRNEREAQDAIDDGDPSVATSLRAAAWQISVCGDYLRAMQPPAEWQCAEAVPACGAAQNVEWGHEDGFGGGLTERNHDGQD